MKMLSKKYLLIIFAVVVMLTGMLFAGTPVKTARATSMSESEPNDTAGTANTIKINMFINGNLSTEDDVDWYKFTIPIDGYIVVNFKHTDVSSTSVYWKFEIYQSDGVTHYDGVDTYHSVPGNENVSSCQMGIGVGDYYLKVYSDYYSDAAYSINIDFTPSNNWETEVNNSYSQADEIGRNAVYFGSLRSRGDVDWYKFTLDSYCELDIKFSHINLESSDTYWYVELLDSDAYSCITEFYVTGDSENTFSGFVSFSSGTYYLKISSHNHSDVMYAVSLTEKHEHTGNWIETLAPTCTSTGSESRTCTICGYIETRELAMLDHSMSGWIETVAPTCSSVGSAYRSCIECGFVETKELPLLDHKMGDWIETLAPTCTSMGSEARTCSKCGFVETRYMKMLDHTMSNWVETLAPTCTSDGSRTRKCTMCGLVETEDIAAYGHNMSDWEVTVAPTCTSDGSEAQTCILCGMVGRTRVLNALGHDYDDGVKVKKAFIKSGEIKYTCKRCGDSYIDEISGKPWLIPVFIVVGILLIVGLVNYIKMMKKSS